MSNGRSEQALQKLRLLVADDEILVRQGLCGLLALEEDFEVVGQVSNGADALAAAVELNPDVVLMDIQMPVMNGVEATMRLRDEHPAIRVLVLTTFADDALVVQAMQAGAAGYLLKDSGAKQVSSAIRAVAQGYMALDSDVSGKLWQAAKAGRTPELERFTPREREVLAKLAEGKTNADIAAEFGVTEKTVRDHIGNILANLNLRDRTQAALWAQKHLS